jgi:N-methylhydantoinase B
VSDAGIRSGGTGVDPITLEVLRGRFDSVTEEMQAALIHASYSPIVTEGKDATSAIFDRRGRTISQPSAEPVHLGVLMDPAKLIAERYPQGVARPGDLYISNDPYAGGSSHSPDIAIFAPVFFRERLVGYAATMTHHSDIGGLAPGRLNVEAIDIHAEGVRIPLLRLAHGGVLNEEAFALIVAASRTPTNIRGDLHAQIAACKTGVARFAVIFDDYEFDLVHVAIDELMDYAERMTRSEIELIPDGEYECVDWLDSDAVTPGGAPIEFCVKITVSGSDIHFDFSGSAPQVKSALNNVRSSTVAVCYYAVRLLAGDAVPNNEGSYRPVRATTPLGTIVNAMYPAPVAVRGIALKRIEDVVLGAMVRMLPGRMTASHSGQYSMIMVSGDDGHGRRVQGLTGGPYAGGHGARPNKDGIDVTEHGVTNGAAFPVEFSESKLPVLFRRVELWTDSGGAGTWRGGLGYVAETEWRGGEAMANIRRERHKFVPRGVEGGHDSLRCETRLVRANGEALSLPGVARLNVTRGDIFCVKTTGSGGYGPPTLRNPSLVLDDVLDGRVSLDAARALYGVIIRDDAIDTDATRVLRATLNAPREVAAK